MFNVLWRRTTVSAIPLQLARRHLTITTPFVPPESLNDVASASDASPPLGRPPARGRYDPALKPSSPTFYTGRAAYYDGLLELEDAANVTRQALKAMSLYPLPRFARDSLPPLQPMWRDKRNMGSVVGATLSTARYRRMVNVLNELNNFKRIAETVGVAELTDHLAELLGTYEKANKEAVLARGKRKPVEFDEYGRTYTVGRRKESSARVWVIPVQRPPAPTVEETKDTQVDDVAPFLPASFSEKPAAPTVVTTTNIIINNAPLHEYFPTPTDRERVIRPLKVAGLLGAFNVFAIARGGGTTGQSGAVSLGIAKALAAHVPDVEQILRKAKLMRRDPRMVERKKTNLAKARKAYQWVKR